MTNNTSKSYTTPLVTFTFLAVSLTGLFMIFEIRNYALREIHIWTGALFLIGGLIHVMLNWSSLVKTLSRKQAYLTLIPVALIALIFSLAPDQGRDRHACSGSGNGHSYESGGHKSFDGDHKYREHRSRGMGKRRGR